jgi:hypothetical protein
MTAIDHNKERWSKAGIIFLKRKKKNKKKMEIIVLA